MRIGKEKMNTKINKMQPPKYLGLMRCKNSNNNKMKMTEKNMTLNYK